MPSTPLCAKCKSWVRHQGDSWCIGCTAASELALELQRTWAAPLRRIAHSQLIATTQQLKALRAFGTGLHSKQQSESSRRTDQPGAEQTRAPPKEKSESEESRGALPRRRSTTAKQAAREPEALEENDSSEESYDSWDEKEFEKKESAPPPDPGHQPIKDEEKKPPEPDHPPPSRGRSRSRERKKSQTDRPKLVDRRGVQASNRTHPGRRRRAGRKHQRLYRLLDDPQKAVHQRLPDSVWALPETFEASQLAPWVWNE